MTDSRLHSSSSARAVPPFYAMAMAAKASERAGAGLQTLHLEVGQPGTSAPAAAQRAVIDALQSGSNFGYTNAPGLGALRSRIATHYAEEYAFDVDPRRIVIVSGASAGFTLAFLASFDRGQRVGILEPGYPAYRNTLIALGLEPVAIAVEPDTSWAPTPEILDAAGHLDGLIIASPSNPTGTILDVDTLQQLGKYCNEHGIQVISDEIYHGITYADVTEADSDSEHRTFAMTTPTMISIDPTAIVINSFSKYFSMTGWRLGWMILPDHVNEAVQRLQQNLYICAPHISQVAGLAAMDCRDELDAHVARYREHRDLLINGLTRAGITSLAHPNGAFYVYADVSHLTDDSRNLCERWLGDLGVATTPGLDFDLRRGHHFVRFSYAGQRDHIVEACDLLAGWTP